MTSEQALKELKQLANPEVAQHSQRFFKTGKGEYGEGDLFLGIRVPVVRKQVSKFKNLPLPEVINLLHSELHEVRLFALLVMVAQFARGEESVQTDIYQRYLDNTGFINNWDLVDSSAHKIVGPYLIDKDRTVLYQLAESESLWERRIAVIATFYFIAQGQFTDTLALCEKLVNDPEDLIHKATGWALREVGKRNIQAERTFLDKHASNMPRTMLRYAIEKFTKEERHHYMNQ